MDIKQQVASLELCKRLRELGVPQNGLFYYQNNPFDDGVEFIDLMIREESESNCNVIMNSECENDDHPTYSAFTVCELGELLPVTMVFEKHRNGEWKMFDNLNFGFYSTDIKEADARAKMLVYLLENNLMELPKETENV